MNIVQKRIAAERELVAAQKTLRNFDILSKGLNAEIARMHVPALKSARVQLEIAKKRFARAKELVQIRIKVLKASKALNALKKR
jgi:hypothetical protein